MPSDELTSGPGISRRDLEESWDFLLVAEGLSYPEASYPHRRTPSEVQALPKPVVRERFSWEDMYSK